jgi:hypothetical protein
MFFIVCRATEEQERAPHARSGSRVSEQAPVPA